MFYSGVFQNRILEISIGVGTVAIVTLALTFRAFRKPKKITRIIDTMEALNKQTVHIKNRDYVEDIVSQLIKGSSEKLQVIADFDWTMTRVHLNKIPCCTTFGIIDTSHLTSDEYKNQVEILNKYYHAIEVDHSLSNAQKTPYMLEWYSKSCALMSTTGVTKSSLSEMVSSSSLCFRDGTDHVLQTLYKHNVPLLVFSAGVGDLLNEALRQQKLLFPNIKVIANFMSFDEQGKLIGMKEGMIHTFNKNVASVGNKDYFDRLKCRNNILLLGDSLGDPDMVEGIEDVNAILKIGFLNFNIEKNLPQYLERYDIVITDDQTMDVVVGLLQSIL